MKGAIGPIGDKDILLGNSYLPSPHPLPLAEIFIKGDRALKAEKFSRVDQPPVLDGGGRDGV
jgi:hypothetical protein